MEDTPPIQPSGSRVITSRDGLLTLRGSAELVISNLARDLHISVDDLLERIGTETERQKIARLMRMKEGVEAS